MLSFLGRLDRSWGGSMLAAPGPSWKHRRSARTVGRSARTARRGASTARRSARTARRGARTAAATTATTATATAPARRAQAAATHCHCSSLPTKKATAQQEEEEEEGHTPSATHCPGQCRPPHRKSWPGTVRATQSAACGNSGSFARSCPRTFLPTPACAHSALRCAGRVVAQAPCRLR